jgi:PPOX class probable F420-dependent enzyme
MTIPDRYKDILDKKSFAHVATIGPKGQPQSSPVWIDFDGEYLRFSNLRSRQKYKNLKRDPRVAISIVDPDDPYRYVEIRGTVERIDNDEDNAFINAMAKKYIDKDIYPWHKEGHERVVIYVRPESHSSMG